MAFQVLSVVRLMTPDPRPPDGPDDDRIQAEHLAYLRMLAGVGKIAVNGPIRAVDSPDWRGLTVYLVDVDEETGPFEYVPGSAGDGPYAGEWPWRPLGENYPPHEELTARIPEAAIRTFTAPRGTVIFCDTSGFHRGGFATSRPRVLATVTYSSPASLASLTERNYRFSGDLEALDDVQRYAVG